jgi:hypothetical protein
MLSVSVLSADHIFKSALQTASLGFGVGVESEPCAAIVLDVANARITIKSVFMSFSLYPV